MRLLAACGEAWEVGGAVPAQRCGVNNRLPCACHGVIANEGKLSALCRVYVARHTASGAAHR